MPGLPRLKARSLWVTAIHMHDGTALWRGRFGQARPLFVGMPNHGPGGFEVALAVGVGTPANLYIASQSRSAWALRAICVEQPSADG